MDLLGFLLITVICIGLGASILVGVKLKRRLVKGGNKYPNIISIVTGVFTFAVILFAIAYVVLANMTFER